MSSPPLQRQSQVALGGSGMRRELMGPEELYTSEDQVSCRVVLAYRIAQA